MNRKPRQEAGASYRLPRRIGGIDMFNDMPYRVVTRSQVALCMGVLSLNHPPCINNLLSRRSLTDFGALTRNLLKHNISRSGVVRPYKRHIKQDAQGMCERFGLALGLDTPNKLGAIIWVWEKLKTGLVTIHADTYFMSRCQNE